MSAVTMRTVFPEGEYNPDLLNRQERAFLLEHLGKTPRQVFGDRQPEELRPGLDIPRGVNPLQAYILFQRFWEESQSETGAELLEKVRKMTLACNVAQARGEEQTREFGGIDYASIGVGQGEGQTAIRKSFVVSLSVRKHAPRTNWIQDITGSELSDDALIEQLAADELRARGNDSLLAGAENTVQEPAPEPVNEEAVNVLTLACPFCYKPFTHPNNPVKAVHMHVMAAHKNQKDKWAEIRPDIEAKLDAL